MLTRRVPELGRDGRVDWNLWDLTCVTCVGSDLCDRCQIAERVYWSLSELSRVLCQAGKALVAAKALVAHGEWLPWVEQNFHGGRFTSSNYMKLATNVDRVQHLLESNPEPQYP